jgi:hypothetical protein
MITNWGFMSFPDTIQQCSNLSIAQNRSVGDPTAGSGVTRICLKDVGQPNLKSYQFFSLTTAAPTLVPTQHPVTSSNTSNTTAPVSNSSIMNIDLTLLFSLMIGLSLLFIVNYNVIL